MIPVWKKYNGSDAQIAEIKAAKNGYIVRGRYCPPKQSCHQGYVFNDRIHDYFIFDSPASWYEAEYLICQPHPLKEMADRQFRTGQPVFVDRKDGLPNATFVTTKPNWNIPNAEYSFTPFEDWI